MRHLDRNSVVIVLAPDRAGEFHLKRQLRGEHARQGHDPVQAARVELEVLDAEVEWSGEPQPAAVEHSDDEDGRIIGLVTNGLQ